MITIKSFVFGPFQENTYVLSDNSNECVIIDPGCLYPEEEKSISSYIEQNSLKPVKLLLTHAHIDHVIGVKFIAETYDLTPQMHQAEKIIWSEMTPGAAQMYGIPYVAGPEPDTDITETEKVIFGNSELKVLHTPGHAPGHVVYINEKGRFVINGDVLFLGSIGRTDFPYCSHEDLIKSIKNKLFPLGDDFKVYTGHGEPTTIGYEKANNPFVGVEVG